VQAITVARWHWEAEFETASKRATDIYYKCTVRMFFSRDFYLMANDGSEPVNMAIRAPIRVTVT